MKHFFIDTNLLIDFLTDRDPFAESATKLFEFAAGKAVILYISASSINNTYYVVRRKYSHAKAIESILKLTKYLEIIPVDHHIIDASLTSGFSDFEDAIQNYCAESIADIGAIITRNEKDYKKSRLPVLNPDTALSIIAGDLE